VKIAAMNTDAWCYC